jgi:small subunit ribosomal protein S6
LFIVQPNATDEEVQAAATGVQSLVTQDGGAVTVKDIWGKRRLAYEVKKFNEGIYVLMRFQSPGDSVKKLETHFKLNDDIIRYLVVAFDDKLLRLEEEQKALTAAALARQNAEGRRRGEDDEEEDERPARGRGGPRRGPRRRDDDDED